MSMDQSEYLDELCEDIKGHRNWAYFDTLNSSEREKALENKQTVVVFYDEDVEKGICVICGTEFDMDALHQTSTGNKCDICYANTE